MVMDRYSGAGELRPDGEPGKASKSSEVLRRGARTGDDEKEGVNDFEGMSASTSVGNVSTSLLKDTIVAQGKRSCREAVEVSID